VAPGPGDIPRLVQRRPQLAPPGPIEQGLEASAIGVQVVSKTASAVAYGAQIQASTLPSCEQAFTGTVTVSNGGINVTGTSLFNNNVGIIGSLNASQNVTASQVHATQGISADGGAIWLMTPKVGRPNYVDASDISEAAPTAGLSTTTSVAAGPDWSATKLVSPKSAQTGRR